MLEVNPLEPKQGASMGNRGTEVTDRIRAAVEKNPRRMTLQLARDLGVPEIEIIRALPENRAVELDFNRWQELLRSFAELGDVRVLVSNGAATIEVVGQFGGFSTSGDFFNVQNESLDMHIRSSLLSGVFAVEKPGHMDGAATHSFQFYDSLGNAAFKVFLTFGGPALSERVKQFTDLRDKFKLPAADQSLGAEQKCSDFGG